MKKTDQVKKTVGEDRPSQKTVGEDRPSQKNSWRRWTKSNKSVEEKYKAMYFPIYLYGGAKPPPITRS